MSLLKILYLITFKISLFSNIAYSQNIDIVVATVDKEKIYLEEVMRLVEQLPKEFKDKPLETYFSDIINDIIDTKLAAKIAKSENLMLEPKIANNMEIASNRVLAEAWISKKIREKITEKEIKSAYDTFIADKKSREEISVKHILVKEEKEAINIINELENGADFSDLAREKSIGPSGPSGGDLGYFTKGEMVPAFENAAFSLEIGTFTSKPVQTQFGWHVIILQDKRFAKPPKFAEVEIQIRQNLINQNLALIFEKLRSKAKINVKNFSEIREEAKNASKNK